MSNFSYKIGIVGLWHLGCVLCACWSKLKNKVIGFDYDDSLIKKLNKAIPPLFEPNLSEIIQEGIDKKLLRFSSEINVLKDCDFIFLAYDTPIHNDDTSDTSILKKAVRDLSRIMKDKAILIVSSQSPVGLCQTLRKKLKRKNYSLDLAYSPENLRLGQAIQCYLEPGHIILGTADLHTEERCKELFSKINSNILSMKLESAEIVKHGINAFLATSIVFANQLADICELSEANIKDVVLGMKADPRIGEKAYLSAGIGFSGGTLGRDLKVLEQKNLLKNRDAKLFGIIYKLNKEKKKSIISKIQKILNRVKGNSIGVLGLTYKPETSTLRQSHPLEIIKLLMRKKFRIKVFDPKADYSELNIKPKFTIASDIKEVARDVDLLVLFTEWEEFREYEWKDISKKMRHPLFFDTKNFLNEVKMISSGFKYFSIGR